MSLDTKEVTTLKLMQGQAMAMPWASMAVSEKFCTAEGELHSDGVTIRATPGGFTISKFCDPVQGHYSVFVPDHRISTVTTFSPVKPAAPKPAPKK